MLPVRLAVVCILLRNVLLAIPGVRGNELDQGGVGAARCEQADETANTLSHSLLALQTDLEMSAKKLHHLQQHVKATNKRVADALATNGSGWCMIPRVIHQSWKNNKLPPKFKMWQKSWLKHNPGWHYKLWTDDDNYQLMITHFPWFNHT
jgi:mannosyltransferase OCH1-like enzyme